MEHLEAPEYATACIRLNIWTDSFDIPFAVTTTVERCVKLGEGWGWVVTTNRLHTEASKECLTELVRICDYYGKDRLW